MQESPEESAEQVAEVAEPVQESPAESAEQVAEVAAAGEQESPEEVAAEQVMPEACGT